MPEKKTIARARKDKQEGKSAGTQAGEFVKERMDKIPAGKRGGENVKQAIAIGLSEARRAGVAVKPQAAKKAVANRSAADRSNAAKKAATTRKKAR